MNQHIQKKNYVCKNFLRTLAISSNRLAFYDFLTGENQAGGLLALRWLSILIGEQRMFYNENQ
tara:strand:- start:220 stop:408 length:189 start_codon:yes stop_codon:yes gene_type:complete